MVDMKNKEIAQLQQELTEAKTALETAKGNYDHETKVLRMEHEAELQKVQAKMKAIQDAANEMGATYNQQMDGVKAAAVREVELIQQLCHARTAELSNELQVANDKLRRYEDRSSEAVAEVRKEMKRAEEKCITQLQDQQRRFETMRDALQKERQQVEEQRDKALTELSAAKESV